MKGSCKILFILLLLPASLIAQQPGYPLMDQDSLKIPALNPLFKKRSGRAISGLLLANLIPWTYDKYITQAHSADITFKSIGHNLNPGNWSWDDGNFSTNQFAHPFHGSIFFNAYRANGYNFWESIPGVFAGSYIWETAAESLDFSINDFINTSYGGVIIGEMTHKFANRLINQRSTGIKRQANEVLALIINPANGLNRLLNGKWGKLQTKSTQQDTSRIYTEMDVGVRKISINKQNGTFRWYGHIKLLYGTPFDDLSTPFSYLNIDAEFEEGHNNIVNLFTIYGSLNGWSLGSNHKHRHAGILTAIYEYINNEIFSYSSQSVKFNIISDFTVSDKLRISTAIGSGPILLAAVPDPYLYKNRAYDYCSGVGFNISGRINYKNQFFYGLNYRHGLFKTLSGNSSYHFLHTLTSEIRYNYAKGLSICIEPGYLTLKGKYKNFNNINNNYSYLRFSARYSIDPYR